MGSKTNSSRTFPTDGLCEYIFYDSVYKAGPVEFEPYDLDADFRLFIDERKRFAATEFGIGYSFRYAYYLKEVIASTTAPAPFMMWYLWRHRICHFGVVDTPTRDLNESYVTAALESLKIADKVTDQHRAKGYVCITVFAAVIPDDTWENYYLDAFPNIFTPQLFIALGHYECGDNTFQDCHVVPPTLLSRPAQLSAANSSYQHDMTVTADSVGKMAARGVKAVWAISVTMKGRWTVPEETETPGFLCACAYDPEAKSFGSYAEVCNDPKFGHEYNYSLELHAAQYYSASDHRLFSFDDEVALGQKLCTVKARHTSIDIGIAVFDVDYEDFDNVCARTNWGGKFSRLRAVQLLLNFFRTKFSDPSANDTCLGLIT
ncbi:hypothetical protein HPB52_002040 [Rhipicephalus sanguineus]|uniref:Uncharacterized protein n=1 Tax=Rhipicephalus sanguineus TaxID=34632 RepID=A0A9D4SRR8_RHISA|nr:hypothetical protein HPB52_002040 [Rhipicephalus sanguineus]